MTRHILLCLTLSVSASLPVVAQPATVSGTVTYRERIALSPTASLEITLEDVSRVDASGVIVSRATLAAPGQVPIPFELPYDPDQIEAGHRYAMRARIFDGQRLLFTTTDNTLVITQGHTSRVSLLLRATPDARTAPAAVAPMPPQAAPPARMAAPPAPVVELRNLPATFTGTLPCADCAGIRYALTLFPDDVFLLRTTYVGRPPTGNQDFLGSWVLSSDRRVVVLEGRDGTPEYFAIRDGATLRKLDRDGQPIVSQANHDLRRAQAVAALDAKGTFRGVYTYMADAGRFTDCRSGLSWPVAQQAANQQLESSYAQARSRPGQAVIATVEGRLAQIAAADRAGTETSLVVDRVVGVTASESCAPRFTSATLEQTSWKLTWVAGATVAPAVAPRNEPGLSFRADAMGFSGSGGCNRLAGQYQVSGESLAMRAAGTLMACPGADAVDNAFRLAINNTRGYRILGSTLELMDADRKIVARFVAK